MARKVDKKKDNTPWWSEYSPMEPRKEKTKVRSVRGRKKGKVITDYGYKKEVGYESIPRSGYASAFLRLFTLFLAIMVLFNVATGAGYKTYKDIVSFAYGATETIGAVATYAMNSLTAVSNFLNPDSFGSRNPNGVDSDGCFYVKVRRNFEYRDYYKVKLYVPDLNSVIPYNEIYYEVVESNYSKVKVGTLFQITNNIFKGDVCINYLNFFEENDKKFDKFPQAYSSGHRIRHCSQAEYLENVKE